MKYYKTPVLIKWHDIITDFGWADYKRHTVAKCETVGFILKRSKGDIKKEQIRVVMTHGKGIEGGLNGCKVFPLGCIKKIIKLK